MWTSMSIGKKIWVGLAILIAGYFISTAVGTVNGKKLQTHLYHVSETLFPASHQSKTALTAFKDQMKFYNDAIMTGDPDVLAEAKSKSEEAVSSLNAIAKLGMVDRETTERLGRMVKRLEAFNAKAHPAYATMSSGNFDMDMGALTGEIKTLAGEKEILVTELRELTDYFSNRLKTMLDDSGKATSRQVLMNGVLFVLFVLVSGVFTSFIISRSVTRPLSDTVFMIRDIAEGEGDLTKRLKVAGRDEVGELARWFNVFVENLQDMISNIADNAKTLNDSSRELAGLSGLLSSGAGEISSRSDTVSQASGELSGTMNSISGSMEEASHNTGTVAAAAEEMSATIREIAGNSEKARSITEQAVVKVDDASKRVRDLGGAADDIGKVTEAINDISEQTNLLALNATIEAARAGEAGKGFAVVANEIKELARQTAQATSDIKTKVEGIQGSTSQTVADITDISHIIRDVTDIVGTIAAAVEEQTASTREISDNVNRVAQVIQSINGNVGQSSSHTVRIAEDMHEFNTITATMEDNCNRMNTGVRDLESMAHVLAERVGVFRI